MTFENDGRFVQMITSALCGTALAAAMYYFLRDAVNSYEAEDAKNDKRTLHAICADSELSIGGATIRINRILRNDAKLNELGIGRNVLSDVGATVEKIIATDPDQLKLVRDRLRSCIERINDLAHLKAIVARRKAIAYDKQNDEHEALLRSLWSALKPDESLTQRVSKQWGAIGFQGTDPSTDFRGMGILGLEQLHYFASRHGTEAKHALSLSFGDGSPLSGFPFAITGINISSLLVSALNEGRLDRELLLRSPDRAQFDTLYAQVFATFAREYTASNPENIASFPPFFVDFSKRLESIVDSPASASD